MFCQYQMQIFENQIKTKLTTIQLLFFCQIKEKVLKKTLDICVHTVLRLLRRQENNLT